MMYVNVDGTIHPDHLREHGPAAWIYKMKEVNFPQRPWKDSESVRKTIKKRCMHEMCLQCHGSGIKGNGQIYVHMISCPCEKCSPGRC